MNKYRKPGLVFILLVSGVLLTLSSCKKELVYVYEVESEQVVIDGASKPNVKSDIEFISVAYTDLYGTTIPQSLLDDLSLAYTSFGDKAVIIEMIILNFLNDPGITIPTLGEMQGDPGGFVEDTYKKLYVRKPTAFEKWYIVNEINNNTDITPEVIYYAMMTSQEYRYY